MGNGKKLSEMLAGADFACVLGLTQTRGGQKAVVERGVPRSYGYNHGVHVVYDEQGRPWIKEGDDFSSQQFGLEWYRCGAHVPFTNSGNPRERVQAIAAMKGVR